MRPVSYEVVTRDGAEFFGEWTGPLDEVVQKAARHAEGEGWSEWQLREREGHQVVAWYPSAEGDGIAVVDRGQ